ncbi:MAG: hypothetical protein V4773_14940 [Verrucomicrobiota bacterium]
MKNAAPAGFARFSVSRGMVALARRSIGLALVASALVFAVARLEAVQLLPGVYGYGTLRASGVAGNTAGFGTNAVIIHVTNLLDRDASGATISGSLRHAVTQDTGGLPRVVVFDVSGPITLSKWLKIDKSNVTIAGQAAPGPVALEGAPLIVGTGVTDILVQHLRVRPGDRWYKLSTDNVTHNRDGAVVEPGATNVVFDHCTFAWSLDELAQGIGNYDNVTFNRCVFAEPMFISIHLDENTFMTNAPRQAELHAFTHSGLSASNPPPVETVAHAQAVDTNYHRVNANSDADFIEYTIPIPATTSNRDEEHILISGIAGPNRGKFYAEVRTGSGSTWTLKQTSEVFDMYAPSETQVTFVARAGTPVEFSLGTAATTMKVKLIVAGKNAASSGRTLGIDQLSLSQPHGMGPYFWDGGSLGGKLSFIGCVFAHLQARGPWVGSRNLVIANSVFYNREQRFVMLGVGGVPSAMNAYIVGNTFREGGDWNNYVSPVKNTNLPGGSLIRVQDNTYDHGVVQDGIAPETVDIPAAYDGTNHGSNPVTMTEGMSGFTALSATAAYESVFLDAGAWASRRDEIEKRVSDDILASGSVTNQKNRPGHLKDSVAQTGGWPTTTTASAVWAPPGSPNTMNGDYTNLEIHLQRLAGLASGSPTPGATQAESGTLGGGTLLEATNLGKVGTHYVNFQVGSVGAPSTLTFNNVSGAGGGPKKLRIRHALGNTTTRVGELVVNGVPQSISFAPTGAFNTWANKDVAVTLNNNSTNTIVFKAIGNDLANIDEISVY